MTQGSNGAVTNVRADASTQSADDGGGKKTESGRLPAVVVYHDIFNLAFIFWLNIANFLFLHTGRHFYLFFYSTMVYFVADLLYVAIVPRSVKSPMVILIHHVITALYLLIPYHYPNYGWCMSYCMLVEINTWLLIAKRTIRMPVVTKLLEAGFYISWVLLRNIFYPYLIFVFYRLWQNETRISGTPWNAIGITPIFQVALTGLNYYWTLSLVMKPSKKKQL
ncbi:hypothetical protein CHLRE_16g683700v5 [Chlamydomonas reinhardtii]|uniref:TLC domain-containing protein n=1 Tax=Chlamydomonas reinhardtii TaxID=3055 RepID=A8IS65_CHLRE|nr:uncharacterized protein CHLRE_16g683700v5 [Chlamydomonas reinhardtii]PNW72070.1 hypothetical protein CHLRE_16g683700v5 [Chlamydomonas reinhardtii]|eukprot:XP_001692076.1 hypothetical protein CHLREDRAFT_189295 [Chlamydomonas reinhardtii]